MKDRKKRKMEGTDTSDTRRRILKGTAAAAGLLALGPGKAAGEKTGWADPRSFQNPDPIRLDGDVKVVHSVCLGCNARCGNRAVVRGGRLLKYSGNPYHPYNSLGHPIDYKTPVEETLGLSSPVCGKAHDAPNYVYNPYRVIKPLKRAGERGSGKFQPIEWDQMIREIAEGGRLFAHIGEDREVPGLKDLDSDDPIDPEAPELGPKRNGFVFMTGRLQTGRKAVINRFVKEAFGSKNRIGHTDICGIGFRMGNYTLTEKKQWELKADPWEAEYILVFGANIYEALQPGVNTYGAAVARRNSRGEVKFSIVDPRAQNASAHAEDWIPIKPGQDGAFAMGMIRWMIENRKYNRVYLAAPNPKAALDLGHTCYSNATHLVIEDTSHANHRRFLRIGDLDPGAPKKRKEAYVVLSTEDGSPLAFDLVKEAILDKETRVRDSAGKEINVKTVFRAMKQGVMEHSLDEYAAFSGVPRVQIEKTASEFSSHGIRAAVCQYHGAGNYVSGTYAAYAVAVLNVLVGSVESRGGYLTSGGGVAKWKKGLYDLKDFPGKRKPKGVMISREKSAYEKSSEYRRKKAATGSGYPSRRPWFTFTRGGLSVETMSGIDQQYPYRCQVLFHYFYNPVYSTPGGYRFKETLKDTDKVPLYVSIDTGVNESNIFADYIVPDVTYPEGHYGWISPHAPALRFTGFRTPCIEPLTGETADRRPFSLETFLIDLAEILGLPGFGKKAVFGRDGRLYSFHRAEDFYLKGFANIAHNAGIPRASAEEAAFVEKNYPVARFKEILPDDQWRQTCYALARGGIFKKYNEVFEGQKFKYGIQRVVLYNEDLATARNSLTGEYFPGTLKYVPPKDSAGNIIEEIDRDYPFYLISHKMNVHTQSRSNSHLWAMEIFPENFVVMNEKDAEKNGISDGDRVRLVSRSNRVGIEGKVKVSGLIRRACLGVSFHYGHTQLGASRLFLKDGEKVFLGGRNVMDRDGLIPDPKLGAGINPNMVSRLDENLANTPMIDVQAGIPDFSSTRVKVTKA